jgi:hypothetical protein
VLDVLRSNACLKRGIIECGSLSHVGRSMQWVSGGAYLRRIGEQGRELAVGVRCAYLLAGEEAGSLTCVV